MNPCLLNRPNPNKKLRPSDRRKTKTLTDPQHGGPSGRTVDSSVQMTLPCIEPHGRLSRMDDSCLRRGLAYTEDSSVRKSLPHSRVVRTEDSSERKTLPYGRLFLTEDFSVQKTLPSGRLFCAEGSAPGTADKKLGDPQTLPK